MASILMHRKGRECCLAEPDFIPVFLEIYIATYPRRFSTTTMFIAHCMVKGLERVVDEPQHKSRLLADIHEYDAQDPDTLLCALAKDMETIYNFPFEEFVMPYIQLTRKLPNSDVLVSSFIQAGGGERVMSLLLRAVSSPIDDEISSAFHINEYWMMQLIRLAMSVDQDDVIIDALVAGLPKHFVEVMRDPDGESRAEDYREHATKFFAHVHGPSLVWPHVLQAFANAVVDGEIRYEVDVKESWEALAAELYENYEVRYEAMVKLKAALKDLKWCHNGGQ
ncbi:hypothetical protein HDZ31DRAFT_70896, partial [Schizophyllum fasciatum]